MKLNQKVIILLVVLVLALTSFGFIAEMQANHNLTAGQTAPAVAQANVSINGGQIMAFDLTPPMYTPEVSWNK